MNPETIKPIIFVIAVLAGCIARVYLPYRLKRIEDGRPFDLSYVYTMFVGFLISSVSILNIDIIMGMPLEATSLMLLFVGANGLQDIMNRTVPHKKTGGI